MNGVCITTEEEFIWVLESGGVVCIDIRVDCGYTHRVGVRKVNDFYSVYTDWDSYCVYGIESLIELISCYDVLGCYIAE